ncbi:MAG: hypothetical protein FKY71_12035 [Spiribacter salinus]|uniref:Sulfotransferase family protein n=1 Tax=Spiribacter salinus TaxID=1335746 RepID=A0A540VPU1_9GAMM|nr:MAG: hypothetical protein FKY71_12035 [Spiribacter salinus]
MNIFVLSTGRCGSTTFAVASKHITGSLDKVYGNRAFYVHLIREREEVAHSFVKRYNSGIMEAYRKRVFIGLSSHKTSPLEVCRHYYDTVNANIEMFLKDKDSQLTVWLNNAEEGFASFWNQIGAQGDKAAAIREWQHQHNASAPIPPQ